eukprot:CAMPEP_0198239148 /NCGR_PEP_ID=MMETSP1446-20131203/4654_1 /TAXON_ID=1461542 ORGANISM="Unidentified sp, Strain CCMP2111" /NCGR_SAMPLE_ID=MMETSP1446 /ASSEMBLY_ACC=CAM_ASM_001112 /LENGTH=159 /DNA_ID=CAMNT_0043921699 /DNA_START=154 /DNA_END=630 /DNA_ORIENTATION=-
MGPAKQLLLTLVMPVRDAGRCREILLGMKKRGFGEGYFNGFGGKVEPGETVGEAARRELKEEAGIDAVAIAPVGVLTFHFDDKPMPWEVHVFRCDAFDGLPAESDEMAPKWFRVDEIPYDSMWADDAIWYPLFLAGKKFTGSFHFENTTTLVKSALKEV